jgi:hypothetical protein
MGFGVGSALGWRQELVQQLAPAIQGEGEPLTTVAGASAGQWSTWHNRFIGFGDRDGFLAASDQAMQQQTNKKKGDRNAAVPSQCHPCLATHFSVLSVE